MMLDQLCSARRAPRIKTLRRGARAHAGGICALYHIPIGTPRDWEQAGCEPDQPARAYLTVIALDPTV